MVSTRISWGILTVTVAALASVAMGGSRAMHNSINLQLRDARTLNDFDRLITTHVDERVELTDALIGMLRVEQDIPKKARICYALGEYRAREAVADLSRNIDLTVEVKKEAGKRMPRWGKYPAWEALIKIGFPAIDEMIRNIEASENEKITELSTRVISGITGKVLAETIVQKRADEQTDPAKAAKLGHALYYLRSTKVPRSAKQ